MNDLFYEGDADEPVTEKKGKDLPGKEHSDKVIVEAENFMKDTVLVLPTFGGENMQMRMKVYPRTERLDYGYDARHKLEACCDPQIFKDGLHTTEAEITEKRPLILEKETEHLGHSEDDLAMSDIQQKLIVQPFAPLLPSFGMTRRAESSCLTGKTKESFLTAVLTPDPGKSILWVTAVEVFIHDFLNYWAKIPILSLETDLILQEKLIKVMEKHPIENAAFRMALSIYPCHDRDEDS